MSNIPTLRPCPHCGGAAKMKTTRSKNVWVECDICQAFLLVVFRGEDGEQRATESWNRRAVDPLVADFIAKFRDLQQDNKKSVRALRIAYSKIHHLAKP